MWIIVIICIICLWAGLMNSSSDSKGTPSAPQDRPTPVKKSSVPPLGRRLSWNNYSDICFAIGAFIEAMDASGFIMVAESGKLVFNIGNFSKSYNNMAEKVPSDVIDFLFSMPTILHKNIVDGSNIIYKLKFDISFANLYQKTQSERQQIIDSTTHIVSSCISDGAEATSALLNRKTAIQIREETVAFASHKTLWFNQ